jgi:hypothetical protein
MSSSGKISNNTLELDMLRNEDIHYTDLSFEVMRDKLLDGYIHYTNASSEVKRGNLLDEDISLHRVKT